MSEYIDKNGSNYNIEISIKSKFEDKYSPHNIVDNLISKNSKIQKKKKSNRRMWPDKQLTGVEFEIDDKGFSGHITRKDILLKSEHIDNIDNLHNIVYNWTRNTDIHMPTLSNFYLFGYSMNIVPDNDDMAIVFDSTKRTNVDDFGSLHSYNCDGYISSFKGISSIYFKEKLDIQEGKTYIKKCIEDNLFIITNKKENEKYLDKISD